MGNFKNLSLLLLAMVVSLVISNVYLYHRSYYGQPSFLVISREESNSSSSNQLLHRFDISFKVKEGEQGRKVATVTQQNRLVDSKVGPMNLTTARGGIGNTFGQSPEEKLHNSNSPHWNSNGPYRNPDDPQGNSIATDTHGNHTTLHSTGENPIPHWNSTTKSHWNSTGPRGNPIPQNPTGPRGNPTNPHWTSTDPKNPTNPHSTSSRWNGSQTTGDNVSMHKRQFSGYFLTLRVYEQQTMATGNLMQMQCFVNKLNLAVVQPFMKDSALSTPLDQSQHKHMLQLEDVYHMDEWNEYAEREGYAPLVKWEEFMKYAPREVVLVQMKYPLLSQVKKMKQSGIQFPHPISESMAYKEGCHHKQGEKAMKALNKRNFRVVRRVCFNFLSGDDIPLEVYRNELLGGSSLKNVTVIVNEWRGLGEHQRVLVEENICPGSARYRDIAHSSAKVTRDARLYANKFLHQNGGSNYLAVIARYEMTAITRGIKDKEDSNAVIPICIEETLKEISRIKNKHKLAEVFLSVDIGKYGSNSFRSHRYYDHEQDLKSFVTRAYDNRMNFTDWERSFETVVEKMDGGYIAKVQQATVARAKCVLFVGGGSFQQHAMHLYKDLHPSAEERCIEVQQRCTSKYRPVQ